MRRIIWFGAFVLTTTSSRAAPPAESEVTTTPPAVTTEASAVDLAKAHLKTGDIVGAKAILEQKKRAGTLTTEAAQLLYELSEHWIENGYELSQPGNLKNAATSTKYVLDNRPLQSEIASLYVDSMLYGFGSGIAWLGTVSNIEETALVVVPSLMLSGGAAYTVYAMNDSHKLKRGMPRTISLGLRIGFVESILLTSYGAPNNPKHAAIALWSGATIGAVLGGVVAHSKPISPGRASMMESTALWGGALTALGHATVTNGAPSDSILLSSALGIIGGATAGAYLGGSDTMTLSRVRYLDLGGIAGALVSGGLYLSFAPSSAPPAIATGAVATGIASGWLIAYRMTKAPVPKAETASLNYRVLLSPNEMGGMQLTGFGTF